MRSSLIASLVLAAFSAHAQSEPVTGGPVSLWFVLLLVFVAVIVTGFYIHNQRDDPPRQEPQSRPTKNRPER